MSIATLSPGELAPPLLRIEDASRLAALSRSTLYSLMDQGKLQYAKIGRSRRIVAESLNQLIEQSIVGADT